MGQRRACAKITASLAGRIEYREIPRKISVSQSVPLASDLPTRSHESESVSRRTFLLPRRRRRRWTNGLWSARRHFRCARRKAGRQAGGQEGGRTGRPEVKKKKKKNGEKLSENDEIGSSERGRESEGAAGKARRKTRRDREGEDFISLPRSRSRRSSLSLPSFLFQFMSATDFFLVTLTLSLSLSLSCARRTNFPHLGNPNSQDSGRATAEVCTHAWERTGMMTARRKET